MKKLIAVLLCLLMVLPIFGCSKEEGPTTPENPSSVLQVGFGRADISPPDGSPMRGYGNPTTRLSTEVKDPIYATCIAFTDVNNNTILLYHTDLCASDEVVLNRDSISEATGVPANNIMVSATHTHSGPEISKCSEAYIQSVKDNMVNAAKEAMADRKPAEMYIATTKVESMNFCRHYVMRNGSIAGDNFGSFGSGIAGHVLQADNDLQILRFVREGAKDVMLVNWQTHPKRASEYTDGKSSFITSDIVGPMRDYIEANMDCNFAYFSGASGNINPSSMIKSENVTNDYVEQGQRMGEYAVAACNNMTKVNTHNVQVTDRTYNATAEKGNRTFTISAFSIGDVGFVCAPYEMFSENGQQIKDGSPFEMTFVVTYANGANAYIASEPTYEYGGYEVNYYKYKIGTAEELVSNYVDMLKQLHETR